MTNPDGVSALVAELRGRTKRILPPDWRKDQKCPECGVGADRPKCFFEMGGDCPRHDPENYSPSPFKMVPDELCHRAADALSRSPSVRMDDEMVETGAKLIAGWINYSWEGLGERDNSSEYPDWAFNGIGSLHMQGGKPACRRLAKAILQAALTKATP